MILQLINKETSEHIEDIEIEDELMLQCFAAASEENIPFGEWFNKTLTKHINMLQEEIITDKSKNDLSDYEA